MAGGVGGYTLDVRNRKSMLIGKPDASTSRWGGRLAEPRRGASRSGTEGRPPDFFLPLMGSRVYPASGCDLWRRDASVVVKIKRAIGCLADKREKAPPLPTQHRGRSRGLATLSDDAWMPFAAAEALFDGDETKARKLLSRALKLGEVRSRGVYLPDQKTLDDGRLRDDFEPELIPADRWSTWEFLPVYRGSLSGQMRGLQWLVPEGAALSRICRGYSKVQFSRPDVERFARAARLRASWIPSFCSDSVREVFETARTLAKSYFDEPRWPLHHALNWIACRRIEALTLAPEELLSLRLQATYKGRVDGLDCKNPAHELLTALKKGRLKAIGPDNKELPPEFWDGKSEYRTWPEVRFRRDDMLRLWPDRETPAVDDSTQKGAGAPEAKASDSHATVAVPHSELVEFYRARFGAPGAATNREDMDREAERHFGGSIRFKALSAARTAAGVKGKVGRPRKSGK